MASLLDTIQGKMSGEAPKKPELGQTGQINTLLQAKSGKAAPTSSGPGQSALGERIAARQTELGQQQLGQQAKIGNEQQQAQSTDIQQNADQQQAQFEDKRAGQQQMLAQKSEQLLDSYLREGKKISNARDLMNLEVVGANLRLGNQQYRDQLQREGQRSRLDDKVQFKEQMARQVFSDSEDLMRNEYAFDNVMKADDREFAEELQRMDAADAIELAKSGIEMERTQSQWAAGAKIANLAVGAAGNKYLKSNKSTSLTTPSAADYTANQSLNDNRSGKYSFSDEMLGKKN